MQWFKKVLFCRLLNREVTTIFYYEQVKNGDGSIKTNKVEFCDCEGKEECSNVYDMMDCTCFREMRKIEYQLNRQ
jgi:hypothetical protein